jgi:hypothetical protein
MLTPSSLIFIAKEVVSLLESLPHSRPTLLLLLKGILQDEYLGEVAYSTNPNLFQLLSGYIGSGGGDDDESRSSEECFISLSILHDSISNRFGDIDNLGVIQSIISACDFYSSLQPPSLPILGLCLRLMHTIFAREEQGVRLGLGHFSKFYVALQSCLEVVVDVDHSKIHQLLSLFT